MVPRIGTGRKDARRKQDPDKTGLVKKTSSSDPDMPETTSQKPQNVSNVKDPPRGCETPLAMHDCEVPLQRKTTIPHDSSTAS